MKQRTFRETLEPILKKPERNDRDELVRETIESILVLPVSQRLKFLMELTVWFREQFLSVKSKQAQTRTVLSELFGDLLGCLYEQWPSVILDICDARIVDNVRKQDTGASLPAWIDPAFFRWTDAESSKHAVDVLHEIVGESPEASLAFANQLLERYWRGVEETWETGQMLEGHQFHLNLRTYSAATHIYQAVVSPPAERYSAKLWLKRLIKMAHEGHVWARRSVIYIYEIMCLNAHGDLSKVGIEGVDDPENSRYSQRWDAFDKNGDAQLDFGVSPSVFRLSSSYAGLLRKILSPEVERLRGERREARLLGEAFTAAGTHAEARAAAQWADVTDRPRRLIRPRKLDYVEVKMRLLAIVGIRGLVFDADAGEYPDIGVELLIDKGHPVLRTYHTTLNGLKRLSENVLYSRSFFDHALLRQILYLVALDILHQIVCGGKRELRIHPEYNEFANLTRDARGRIVVRRGHTRKLFANWQMSDYAKKRALKAGIKNVPNGRTFVGSVDNTEEGEQPLPVAPFAIYDDGDFMEGVEEHVSVVD